MKKKLCVVNVLIAFLCFLLLFGDVCYRYGVKRDASFPERVWLCIFLFGLLVIALILAHSTYRPRKGLLFGAVYSLLFDMVFLAVFLVLLVGDGIKGYDPDWISWLGVIGSALVSGLYFWAAFAKEKEGERP